MPVRLESYLYSGCEICLLSNLTVFDQVNFFCVLTDIFYINVNRTEFEYVPRALFRMLTCLLMHLSEDETSDVKGSLLHTHIIICHYII